MQKRALLAVCVVAGVVALLALVPKAYAGEGNALGCIFVADGGSSNNATTGYTLANTNIQAFDIGTSTLLTLQCSRGPCHVAVGAAVTDAGRGLYMAANEKITSSTGSSPVVTLKGDAGAYRGGIVSVAQGAGAVAAEVCVFPRSGTE